LAVWKTHIIKNKLKRKMEHWPMNGLKFHLRSNIKRSSICTLIQKL